MKRLNILIGSTMLAALSNSAAFAVSSEVAGKPEEKGHHFQRPVTEVMRDIVWLDNFMHILMLLIVVFVTGLLLYCIFRFSRKNNPKPATFTHHTGLEVAWTAIPVLILIVIAIPSVKLLFKQLDVPEPDITIKATGYQWYWSYEYPDSGIEFDAVMLQREDLEEYGYNDDEYLLATDERIIVPVDATVHMLVTASDVIHAWTIPSFGSKIDAMPGRINETWFRAEEEGVYFGQCSELCGKDHAYMPIVVEVVSQEKYDAWVTETAALQAAPTSQVAQITSE